MYDILKLNKIAAVATEKLGADYNCVDECSEPVGILVRSAKMHDMDLPDSLLCIARAGAGVNNIPVDKCAEDGICVFNTPGANANAVKELVIAGLLLASRKISEAIIWEKTLKDDPDSLKTVEKGKSQFVGPEITGKTLGIVGLGAIGRLVAGAAVALGMKVIGYDVFTPSNLPEGVELVSSLDDIYANSDYVTLHLPVLDSTKGMINAESIAKMKDGVRLLNFARDGLVVSGDIIDALQSGKMNAYVTDFATNDLIMVDGVVAIPHLGASTPESEDNCAIMAADEMKEYIENGNVKNSVNFPCLSVEKAGEKRFCIFSKAANDSKFTDAIGGTVINNESKDRNGYTYTIIDVDSGNADAFDKLSEMDETILVREL